MSKFKLIIIGILATTGLAFAALNEQDKAQVENNGKNYVVNPGFEAGLGQWVNSGGTFAKATTTNILFGAGSAVFTASGAGQYIESQPVTVPYGLLGRNCLASIVYKGGESGWTLQALDGSANVLGSKVLSAVTTPTGASVNFICPSSGTMKLRLTSTAAAVIVAVDRAYLGEAVNLSEVSQSQMYGMANWPAAASCGWSTVSSSYANYAADSDCTLPAGSNLAGNASAPATKVPGITFASLPPGEYLIQATGSFYKTGTANNACFFRFHDGTSASLNEGNVYTNGIASQSPMIAGRFSYTTAQSNITFQIQGKNDDATNNCQIIATGLPLNIQVYRFPTSSELAYRPEVTAWKVDASVSGGNASLGTSNQASYVELGNSSWSLTNNSGNGNIPAQITCSSTNAPTGTTCAAGSETAGVSFVAPKAGDVLACANFSWSAATGAGGSVDVAFQLVETASNSQTILQEGKGRTNALINTASTTNTFPFRTCGTFTFASAGQKTIRLFYEQSVGGTLTNSLLLADANSSVGQRDLHWEIYPISEALPMPVLVGGVSSNSSGQVRTEYARINCDASSSVVSQSGTWLTPSGNRSTTQCDYTITAGLFSAEPSCVVVNRGTSSASAFAVVATASLVSVYGLNADYDAYLTCMGPR